MLITLYPIAEACPIIFMSELTSRPFLNPGAEEE
jgi:hypothetical protein